MPRFSASTLDLSRFPPPQAIVGYSYEAIFQARILRLKSLLQAVGIPFDVEMLETDPGAIIEQSDTYQELLRIAQINDGVRAGMVAFAIGADLDHLAAYWGVLRAEGESDDSLRERVLLAPEAFSSAGTWGAYVFFARSADPIAIPKGGVDVWSPAPGKVIIAVQSSTGDGTASPELIQKVRDVVLHEDIKPLTDMVTIRSVINFPYTIDLEAFIFDGPDPAAVRAAIEAAEWKNALERQKPSRDISVSAIGGVATTPAVDTVKVKEPLQDIARGRGEVGVLTGLKVKVTPYGG